MVIVKPVLTHSPPNRSRSGQFRLSTGFDAFQARPRDRRVLPSGTKCPLGLADPAVSRTQTELSLNKLSLRFKEVPLGLGFGGRIPVSVNAPQFVLCRFVGFLGRCNRFFCRLDFPPRHL